MAERPIALPPEIPLGGALCCRTSSKEIRECYRRAEECKRLAEDDALTDSGKADYLDMERRWLSLARSYEFAERLSNFTAPFSKRKYKQEEAG